jgi:acyl-coenzyme A synthetase/AMP-(fatty) acid ligase
LSNPKIQDCAVIGVNDLSAGEVPKAFVVKGDQRLSEEEVQKYVAGKKTPYTDSRSALDRVAPYKRLNGGVEFIKEIPKSPSGKILRRFLRDRQAKL